MLFATDLGATLLPSCSPFLCTLESSEHQNIQVAANKYIYWIYPNIEIYTPTLCTFMQQPLYFRVFQMEMQVLANWSIEIYKEIFFYNNFTCD